MAVELRHLQRTEVREVQEGFKPGQKGSSAMPHKRNPISAETITGLVPRAALEPARRAAGRRAVARTRHLALVGRAGRPARLVAARALRDAAPGPAALGSRRVPRAHAAPTSTPATGSCSVSRYCSDWSPRAWSRDDAYRIVQRNAMRAWDESTDFRNAARSRRRGAERPARRRLRPAPVAQQPRRSCSTSSTRSPSDPAGQTVSTPVS